MYLVNGVYGEGEQTVEFSRVMRSGEVFGLMDMADCVPGFDMVVWKINSYTEALSKCSLLPKGFCRQDPQKMEIRWDGGCEVGYGTEH